MGAPVIRQYARLFPEHVAGLVAVDGPLDMRGFGEGFKPPSLEGPEGLKAREGMIRGMFTPNTPPALQEKILAMMLKAPEATAEGAMRSILDPDLRKADVTPMPSLAIWAGTNQQIPNPEETKKVLPHYSQTQVAGTGHFVMMEKPDEFNRRFPSVPVRSLPRGITRGPAGLFAVVPRARLPIRAEPADFVPKRENQYRHTRGITGAMPLARESVRAWPSGQLQP
jgi:pimeloyl-ACP methyl ester carboxylesterase